MVEVKEHTETSALLVLPAIKFMTDRWVQRSGHPLTSAQDYQTPLIFSGVEVNGLLQRIGLPTTLSFKLTLGPSVLLGMSTMSSRLLPIPLSTLDLLLADFKYP